MVLNLIFICDFTCVNFMESVSKCISLFSINLINFKVRCYYNQWSFYCSCFIHFRIKFNVSLRIICNLFKHSQINSLSFLNLIYPNYLCSFLWILIVAMTPTPPVNFIFFRKLFHQIRFTVICRTINPQVPFFVFSYF